MKEELTNQSIEKKRQEQLSRTRDNFSNLQPATAPDPRIGLRIDMLCNYADEDDESDLLMWSQGATQSMSNGTNLPKDGGGFHKKKEMF